MPPEDELLQCPCCETPADGLFWVREPCDTIYLPTLMTRVCALCWAEEPVIDESL